MIEDKAYLKSFKDCPCLISLLQHKYCDSSTVVAHHISGKLNDNWTIPLCHNHHTGENGVHIIGKKTWYEKYISKEDCIELAEFAYSFWHQHKINMFSLDGIQEIIDIYFDKSEKKS